MTAERAKEGMIDFGDGLGRVRAYRRKNPDGTLSGWVADTAFLNPNVHIGPEVRIPSKVVVWAAARLTKSSDLRFGASWAAYPTEQGFLLVSKSPDTSGTSEFSSWDELPRALYKRGFISEMEYLAAVAELEPERVP